jgi:hypothetical protein
LKVRWRRPPIKCQLWGCPQSWQHWRLYSNCWQCQGCLQDLGQVCP